MQQVRGYVQVPQRVAVRQIWYLSQSVRVSEQCLQLVAGRETGREVCEEVTRQINLSENSRSSID